MPTIWRTQMSKVRGELMQMDGGKWGCFLWLVDNHGNSTRTILAIGNTAAEAKEAGLRFARNQHEAAQKRLIRAQSDSIACREMVEALSIVVSPVELDAQMRDRRRAEAHKS